MKGVSYACILEVLQDDVGSATLATRLENRTFCEEEAELLDPRNLGGSFGFVKEVGNISLYL